MIDLQIFNKPCLKRCAPRDNDDDVDADDEVIINIDKDGSHRNALILHLGYIGVYSIDRTMDHIPSTPGSRPKGRLQIMVTLLTLSTISIVFGVERDRDMRTVKKTRIYI